MLQFDTNFRWQQWRRLMLAPWISVVGFPLFIHFFSYFFLGRWLNFFYMCAHSVHIWGGQFNGLMGPQFIFMVRASQTAMHTTETLCFFSGTIPEGDVFGNVLIESNGLVANFQSTLTNAANNVERAKRMYLETLAPGTVRQVLRYIKFAWRITLSFYQISGNRIIATSAQNQKSPI